MGHRGTEMRALSRDWPRGLKRCVHSRWSSPPRLKGMTHWGPRLLGPSLDLHRSLSPLVTAHSMNTSWKFKLKENLQNRAIEYSLA